MKTLWKNRLRKGTKIKVKYLEATVMNAVSDDDDSNKVDSYRCTITSPDLKRSFWILIPEELVEVVDP